MTSSDPPIPPPLAGLLAGVGRAFEGDADAIEDVVTDDVAWVDDDERLDGVDEVVGHFLAHGGWREVFEVQAARPADDGPDRDHWEVDWTLWLRADSTSYRRDGTSRVVLAGGRIASWTSTATEREDGSLDAWGGD
ncbi:nuclear transport factor 2 family protein [Salsipaludibacter albus]|uniref:nuclear transport factor 2 family protein n=1 Tax=Salsipaludibacter albus TaxID=2849650 RepID=UPI001EE41726|nr:nuclear transport factor 2 family protein [Salsipaludibacter albus]MBY5163684.1 nuclear transport factor 2 family protein [Salsipaludibacter albus]